MSSNEKHRLFSESDITRIIRSAIPDDSYSIQFYPEGFHRKDPSGQFYSNIVIFWDFNISYMDLVANALSDFLDIHYKILIPTDYISVIRICYGIDVLPSSVPVKIASGSYKVASGKHKSKSFMDTFLTEIDM